MARNPDPQRRRQLLDEVVDYLVENGLEAISLRPLAAALGTSARMLLYYFDSKEQLIVDALARAREREREMIARSAAAGAAPVDAFLSVWRWMTSGRALPFLKLFFEVYALALQDPKRFEGFAARAVHDWLPFFQDALVSAGLDKEEARRWSTLLIAASRGLLLDLLATRDRKRIASASDLLVDLLSSYPASVGPRRVVGA
jgi:AcrR family transcriptional regulator